MSDILDQALANIPADELRLFDLCDEVSDRIADALAARGWTQRQLAEALGKRESYVSRVLAGGVNLTLKTIAQFEVALGVSLIQVEGSTELNEDVAPYYGPTVLGRPQARIVVVAPFLERPPDRERPLDPELAGAQGRLFHVEASPPASVAAPDAFALAA